MLLLRLVSRCHLPIRRRFATVTGEPGTRDCRTITPPYSKLIANLKHVRKNMQRPLTLAEKILYSHLYDVEGAFSNGPIKRGETYLQLSPERVAMQDASAQMAL
jgi:homoaconitase